MCKGWENGQKMLLASVPGCHRTLLGDNLGATTPQIGSETEGVEGTTNPYFHTAQIPATPRLQGSAYQMKMPLEERTRRGQESHPYCGHWEQTILTLLG